ncbi:YhdP family protein [Roseateles sp. DB2]|uniref:YhdP family protein n=1 Tax=Roseateles sp. DB2 TaxID=3453717 RepID=UPI003EEB27D7
MSSLIAHTLAAVRRPLRWTRRCMRWAVVSLLLLCTLLLAAWLTLHWAILPQLDRWRAPLEQQASKALGLKAEIGRLEAEPGAWLPALTLHDLRLSDAQGRTALRLPEVKAVLSLRSLYALEIRFAQLLISKPELELRRDKTGRIFVAGLDIAEGEQASDGAELADWFFSQPEFVIRQGRIRWVDERRQAPPLELSGLDLVMRNGLLRHDVRLDATPPAAWGQALSLRGRFKQALLSRPSEFQRWSGELFADLPRADVRELRRYLDLPFELSEGDGALRGWAEIREGQPQALTLDMALRSVRMRLSPRVDVLDLGGIAGRLELRRTGSQLTLAAKQLGFELDDRLVWPRSDWSLSVVEEQADSRGVSQDVTQGPAPGRIVGGELRAQHLDLDLLARIATKLPLGEQLRRLVDDIAPQGVLSELSASWEGSLDAPRRYRARGQLQQFSMQAQAGADALHMGRPGLDGASLRFEATDRGGQAQLHITGGSVEFPGVFEAPRIPIQRLSAQLDWRIEPRDQGLPLVELKASEVSVANDDLLGELEATWRTGPGEGVGRGGRLPGLLDINGRLSEAKAAAVWRYLPLGVGEQARHYVRDAVLDGTASNVQFRSRGDLWDFPYDRSRDGQFRISAQARDVLLAYVPSHAARDGAPAYESPWPVMERVQAELLFERGSMSIRNGRAQVLGYELSNVNGGIKDLIHHQVLALEGSGRGPASELIRFVNVSPVGPWTGNALATASGNGNVGLKLSLQMPLDRVEATQLKGSVQLQGNDLRLRPDVPLLGSARGRVDFDHKGMQVVGGQAQVLGGDASLEGGSQKDGSLRFTCQGTATAEGLRRASELGLLSRLGSFMSGQAAYRLLLGIRGGATEVSVQSSLQGLGVELPAPLRKDADASLPLLYQTQGLGPQRDELRLDLGNLLHAQYQRDTSDPESPKVLRGAIAVEDKLPALPDSGVLFQARLGRVQADPWLAAESQLLGSLPASGSAAAGNAEGGYGPSRIQLQAQQLLAGGRAINKLNATLSRTDAWSWRGTLDAEQLAGQIDWRDNAAPQGGRLFARLSRLSLPKSEADSVSQLLDKSDTQVPALDVVVEDFELRGKRLGRLEVEAQLQGPRLPGGREWKLNRLQLKNPDAMLSATGQWKAEAGQTQRRTQLDWQLDVADAGKLLERIGQGQVLRSGRGKLRGQLGWQGSPLSPDYASMAGQLNVALDAGQFLKAEPGVGRLLGVLSLQSLPRRLLLDFRDVFAEGFAFDSFEGDVRIERGLARSENLRMRGVQALVLMDGTADLARETQDLRVLVVPQVNAGGASLAYAAINPAIGLGTFLAQLLLRKPMAAASTSEFHVTGTWESPKVEEVPHKGGVPEDAASRPAGAGSAPASSASAPPSFAS